MHPSKSRASGHNQSMAYLVSSRNTAGNIISGHPGEKEITAGEQTMAICFQGKVCQRTARTIARIAVSAANAVKNTLISIVSRVAMT